MSIITKIWKSLRIKFDPTRSNPILPAVRGGGAALPGTAVSLEKVVRQ